MMVGTAMKQIARLILLLAFSLFFSQAASAQITIEWEDISSGAYYTTFSWVRHSNGLIIGAIQHRRFLVTSGSGYIDVTATLDATGNSVTTRMWVEEGIEFRAKLKLDFVGDPPKRAAIAWESCWTVIFDSEAADVPGSSSLTSLPNSVGGWWCPTAAAISAQVDEFQLNASDGTFTDHVRVTWNEVEGATAYQVFRCTTKSEDSCGDAVGSPDGNGFDDYDGIDDVHYWYRVKACTGGDCGDFSEADEGYRSDGLDDHGNSCVAATPVAVNSTTSGVIEETESPLFFDRDLDYFSVELLSPGTLTVSSSGTTSVEGTLWDTECNSIATNSGFNSPNFLISEQLAEGNYFVSVEGELPIVIGPYQFVSSFEPSSLPSPPAQVSASDGTYTDIIAVTWSSVASATAYNVYYSSSLGSTKTLLGQYTSTSVNVTGAAPGDVWYFWVYSVNVSGESATGTYDTGYIQSTDPEPADLAITILDAVDGTYASGDELIVTNKIENIGGTASGAYRITFYASTDMTITTGDFSIGYIDRAALGVGESHYFNTTLGAPFNSLQDGSYYIGAILSIDDANNSNNSKFDPTPIIISNTSVTIPDAPTLNSVAPGNGYALLVFTANSDGGSAITDYTASCGAFSQAGSSSPITVGGLTNGVEYSCSVIATNAEGDSPSSNVLSVTPIPKDLIYSDGFEAKTN
jgi:hypothetical protein